MTRRPGTRSVLELVHPDGVAARSIVIGDGCPSSIVPPGPPAEADADGVADLIITAPSARESASGAWLERAAERCGTRLERDGVCYVIAPPASRARLRRLLRANGLDVHGGMLHLPDFRHTRQLVVLDRIATARALTQLVPLRRFRHTMAGAAATLPGALALLGALGPVALVARRAGARPLFDWLYHLDDEQVDGRPKVVVTASWDGRPRGAVLHRLASRRRPAVVAKAALDMDAAAANEGPVLARLGPAAARAGACVPRPLRSTSVGGMPVLLESGVAGEIVASVLARRPRRLAALLTHLCGWLGAWQRGAARAAPITRRQLERELLEPAASIAPEIDGGVAYVDALDALCAAAEGTLISTPPAHNDLTMWNVLIDRRGRLGIVDWETAEDSALPLKDFFYAACDAVAATARYRDRLAAAKACFTTAGAHAAMVATLRSTAAAGLIATPKALQLSFHACWLRHATNERRAALDGAPRPFRDIVQWVAREETGVTGR